MEMTAEKARQMRADWMRYARVQMELEDEVEENIDLIKQIFLNNNIRELSVMVERMRSQIDLAMHFSSTKKIKTARAILMAVNGQIDYLIRIGK